MSVPGAVTYYVFFDSRSEVTEQDYCWIQAPLGTNVFVSFQDSWPGISVPPLLLKVPSIVLTFSTNRYGQGSQTTKQDSYYGIRLNVVPIFEDIVAPVILSANTVGESGGGLFMFSGVTFSTLTGAQFVDNETGNGGGMFLRNAIVGLIAHQLRFHSNRAWDEDGGGVAVSSASYGLLFRYCSFANNSAGGSGGALAFINNNGVDGNLYSSDVNQVLGCTFLRNRAVSNGGAVYVGAKSALLISNCMIAESISCGDGGGLMLNEGSTLTATSIDAHDNLSRRCGGAVALGQQNQATISQSVLRGNKAIRSGGALCAKSLSQFVLTNLTVTGCSATEYGGAIACVNSLSPVLKRTALSNNTAARGSALYLYGVAASAIPLASGKQVEMVHNHAHVGTVYWVNGSMPEPVALRNASSYSANTAQFRRELTTQAVLLRVPQVVQVRTYGAFLELIVITLHDTYGQVAPANAPAYVQVGILGASAQQCSGRFPFLSGADVDSAGVPLVNGQAVFSSLEGACSPGGSFTLLFTAHLTDQRDLSDDQQTVYATTQLRFRTCVAGEVIVNGKCVKCPYSSCSLEANVTESTTCTECQSITTVESCEGSSLMVRQGNWRRYSETEAVLPCLSDVNGCAGGNATGDASCLIGFEGPLCSLCSEGYFLSEKTCLPCQDSDQLGPASILFLVVAVIAVAGVMAFLYYKSSRAYSGNAEGVLESLYEVFSWLAEELQGLGSQLKIVITTFQICTTIPVSMNVTFPPQFARFLDSMSFFNLNLLSTVPLACASDPTYTFIDKLVMITLAPIGLSLLLLLCCIVETAHYAVRCCGVKSQETKEIITQVVTRYLTMFLFLTYLVLPFVSTIFRTYLCTDIDPNSEDADGSDSFLTADMRISCNSEYYMRSVLYASIMIVVYVVGIPLLYIVLLYRSRKEIMGRYDVPAPVAGATKEGEQVIEADHAFHPADHLFHEGDEDEPENQLKHRHDRAAYQALMISFPYEAYEPKYWYWEVIETTRRLVLQVRLSSRCSSRMKKTSTILKQKLDSSRSFCLSWVR